ncbi:hypothetical protein B9Z55_020464 [Caenorhabditis nigoni]|uniref:Reticulon-like protein n=1 Tax=Caenorhabditis nigoni TaxID=1611254 RepID=A0A2G5TMX7_9PELO|nr:hypothetical protein B9Z55_020464 [Caenorhabditis nigoni]
MTDLILLKLPFYDDTHSTLKPDQTTEENSDPEVKVLQPLALQSLETANDESGGSSCTDSEDVRLPDEILNAPMDDDVFEDEEIIENVETDLLFRQPTNREMELVYTISKGAAINLDELEEEDEDVDVDLWFREPTDTRFELVYTIPLMEDVSVDSSGERLEDVPPAEELDNVVEEASLAEFTFKPIGNDEETETETLTTEVVTVVERPQDDQGAGEGSRDFIEKVKLTSNDTFDNFDDEEEASQNAFVKSVETPETPVPEYNDDQQDDVRDVSVSEVLKDAAEQLQIIHDSLSPEDVEDEKPTLKQVESAPDFIVEDVEDSAPDVPETRFEISPVENLEAPTTPEATQDAVQNLPMQETSDFAQLEDVPEGVPDVDRTLNALRNEDIFPKEPVPADVSKIDGAPETEVVLHSPEADESSDDVRQTQREEVALIGLEDGGEIETPEIVDLHKSEVESALNSEDVVGIKMESHVANDVISEDQPVEDQPVLGLEECGDVEVAPVVDLEKDDIHEALNTEDVVTASVLPDVVETTDGGSSDDRKANQPVLSLEESGEVETPEIPQLNQSEVEDALNSEDVIGIQTVLPTIPTDTFVFDATSKIEAPSTDENQLHAADDVIPDGQPVLGLEECGDVEIAPVVDLEKEEIEEALNTEDVVTTSAAGLPHVVETADNGLSDDGKADQPILGLEDSGEVETPEIPQLNQADIEDALNSEDVVGIRTESRVADDVISEDQQVERQPVLGLEECGDVEVAPVVDLEKDDIHEALNTEDVVIASVLPEVMETTDDESSDDRKADQPVLSLEDSGEVETPEIPQLNQADIDDALNSEDVVGIKTEFPTIPTDTFVFDATSKIEAPPSDGSQLVLGFEECGDVEAAPIGLEDGGDVETPVFPVLNQSEVEDALNSEDVVGIKRGFPVAADVISENQSVVGLEKCGDVEIAPVVDLEKEDIQAALNTEDVTTSISLLPEVVETVVGGPSDNGKADQPVLGLEDSGEVGTPEISQLNQLEVEAALNSEDVARTTTELPVTEGIVAEIEKTENPIDSSIATKLEQVVVGLEDAGDEMPDLKKEELADSLPTLLSEETTQKTEVTEVSQEEMNNALNSEDVVGIKTVVVDTATDDAVATSEVADDLKEEPNDVPDDVVYNELPPEVEESVTDFQTEEEEVQEKKNEDTPPSTPTSVQAPPTNENAPEHSLMEKLVLMVENALPTGAVLPSEDVLDVHSESQAQGEKETEEPSTQQADAKEDVADTPQQEPETATSEPSSILNKLTFMMESVLPAGNTDSENQAPGEEETEESPTEVKEDVAEPQESETATYEPLGILHKLTSMVESVIPSGNVDSDSQVQEEEETEEPPTQQAGAKEDVADTPQGESETATSEPSSILDKLTSMVESVIPSGNVNSEGQGEKETEEPPTQLTENVADTPQQESETAEPSGILDKLTSMMESVLPVDSVILSEYVNQSEELRNSRSFQDLPTEEGRDQTVNEEAATEIQGSRAADSDFPTLTEGVASEEVETPPLDEKVEKEVDSESVLEKLASVVENAFPAEHVLPSKDVLSESHLEDSATLVENASDDTPTVLEKLVSTVEDVIPVNLISHSENEASQDTGVPSVEESKDVKKLETPEKESVVESLISVVQNAVLPSEDVLSEDHVDDREQDFETPAQPASTMEKLSSMVENVLPANLANKTEEEVSEQQETPLVEKPVNSETVEDESIAKKVVSMVESTLPAEAVLPSEDVLSEDHLEGREEEPEAPIDHNSFSIVDQIVEMVENVIPVSSEVSSDTDIKPTDDMDTEKPKETIMGELASMVENVLPDHEQLDETRQHLNSENQNPSTVETLISTSDIIPPVGRVASFETEFDAEGFVAESTDPPQSEEDTIIETADIILPVDQEDQLETPFDAEDFVHESIEEPVVETKVETEQSENADERTTVMGELVAMAVEILPIDGAVQEAEAGESEKRSADEAESLVAGSVEEPIETTVEKEEKEKLSVVGELVAMAVDIFPIDGASGGETTVSAGEPELVPESIGSQEEMEGFTRVKRGQHLEESNDDIPDHSALQVATVEVETESQPVAETVEESATQLEEEPATKTTVALQESSAPIHGDYGNDYVPFGTETSSKVEFNNPEESKEEEEDFVAELNFHPIRQWKDEDVISLQSLKSLVAEVGCTTDVEHASDQENQESTLKILKVVPSEPSLMELDITNDPSVIHVPIPLMEPATKYLEEMVEWIIADAVKEVGEVEVVTESELSEMVPQESENECPVPEPLADLKLPFEDEEKTPEPEQTNEEVPVERVIPVESESTQMIPIPQRPPRVPKVETAKPTEQPKSPKNRFGPLNIKLGRSYSEEQQKELVESLERPLTVITSPEPKPSEKDDVDALSPLSPNTLEEYEHVPMMDMQSVPHSPQEKQEDTVHVVAVATDATPSEEKEAAKINTVPTETKILGPGKSMEYVANDDEDGSECLDSIGDLSERTIQRFNTSIDDPSIRRDSFSSISSFGDRQKFRTAIENIRQDLLPFQSSVSQFLDPSVKQLLVTNLSMDSPSDLSPNAPPVGFENTAQYLEKLQQQQQQEDRPSAEGSIDSSGFEKVDHESLDDYGTSVEDPMQKSVFGSLTAEDDMVSFLLANVLNGYIENLELYKNCIIFHIFSIIFYRNHQILLAAFFVLFSILF